MASDPRDLLCPTCGQPLGPLPPPSASLSWVRCRHCNASVPVAPSGPAPPRFTWEVYPWLYPRQPPLRPPRFRWPSLIVAVLLAAAFVAFAVAAGAAYYGVAGSQEGHYSVNGVAQLSGGRPWEYGQIVLSDELGNTTSQIGPGGAFSFTGVPTGGVELNVTYPGYAPLLVITFISPVYDAGTQGLVLTLSPGSTANESTVTLSPYPDLEYFQAYVGADATIAAIAGLLSTVAALILLRSDRPALGVVGGASGIAVPFALIIIPVGSVFPLLLLLGLIAGFLGALGFAIAWIEVIQVGDRPSGPIPPRQV